MAAKLGRLDEELARVERMLTEFQRDGSPFLPSGVPVWDGNKHRVKDSVEAWAKTRFAEVCRDAENAILTEVIGFRASLKTLKLAEVTTPPKAQRF